LLCIFLIFAALVVVVVAVLATAGFSRGATQPTHPENSNEDRQKPPEAKAEICYSEVCKKWKKIHSKKREKKKMKRKTLTKRRSSYSSSQLRPISISTSPPPHFASKITIFNNKNVAEKTVAKGSQLIESGERAPGGPIYRYIYTISRRRDDDLLLS